MKIKIKNPVIHKGKYMKKDTVHEVPKKEADDLVSGEFAEEHKEEAKKEPETAK